jgi:hypothetical protein
VLWVFYVISLCFVYFQYYFNISLLLFHKTSVSSSGNVYLCALSNEVHVCGCKLTQNGVEFTNHCCSTQNCNTPNTLTSSSSTNCQCGITNSTTCSAKSGSPLTTKSSWEIPYLLAYNSLYFIIFFLLSFNGNSIILALLNLFIFKINYCI